MTEQRIIIFTRNYDELIGVVRARVEALNCPHEPLEEYLGLSRGHLGKILSPAEEKRLGLFKLWEMFEKLGLVMAVHEHLDIPATIDEMGDKYRPRAGWAKTGRLRKRISPALMSATAQQYGAMGKGMRKVFRISPKRLSQIRRQQANARWHPRPSGAL